MLPCIWLRSCPIIGPGFGSFLNTLKKLQQEYQSLFLAGLFVVLDFVVNVTMLWFLRPWGLHRGNLRIRHLEMYLVVTTMVLLLLIMIGIEWTPGGWLMVLTGSLRIFQVISLNAMTLLFNYRLLCPEVQERDRTRWHFVAIFFSVIDVLIIYAFLNYFFNRLYGILNIRPEGFFDHFYYSMMTLMTVGYGDIVPITSLGKFLAISETFMGVFLFVFLVNAAMGRLQKHSDS